MKKLIPEKIENKIPKNKFVYYFCWLLVGFNFFRSLEHIFAEDGGAESIAGIPLSSYSPEAANNIVSIFAQWGFSQLVLVCILLLVVLKITLVTLSLQKGQMVASVMMKIMSFLFLDKRSRL